MKDKYRCNMSVRLTSILFIILMAFTVIFGISCTNEVAVPQEKQIEKPLEKKEEEKTVTYDMDGGEAQVIVGLHMPWDDGKSYRTDNNNNGRNDWIILYTLMCHSFNWQMRFNNIHQYNSSWGKDRSSFTNRQKDSLIAMKNKISTDITVMSKSFEDIDFSDFDENDLIYFDPPYYNSVGNYNDGKRGFEGWTAEHEKKLYELLDSLDKQGTKWALSNNLKYNNEFLNVWMNRYNIHYLSRDYLNCNYHKKDRETKDIEVLITNY